MWPKRAPDLRVAFITAPDGPNVVTSLDNLDTLITPGSLKTGGPLGDDGLGVGVKVFELPLQLPVMINTTNDRIDAIWGGGLRTTWFVLCA